MTHNLNDFIRIVPLNAPKSFKRINREYRTLTDVLNIPRNNSKDYQGTVIKVLGIKVDINQFKARLPPEKLY